MLDFVIFPIYRVVIRKYMALTNEEAVILRERGVY